MDRQRNQKFTLIQHPPVNKNFQERSLCMGDLVYFVKWDIVTLNYKSVVMALLLLWISLLFMGFVVFNISIENERRD
jgi:hypothetical protein